MYQSRSKFNGVVNFILFNCSMSKISRFSLSVLLSDLLVFFSSTPSLSLLFFAVEALSEISLGSGDTEFKTGATPCPEINTEM